MEPGYIQGSSHNLPVVDLIMIDMYYRNNPDFVSAEVRNVKTQKSTREAYGDSTIGYIQLKREQNICTVKGRVTPEHCRLQKSYAVTVVIDEGSQIVVSCECHDCAVTAGGCKHDVALLLWIHRRSEEPAATPVTNYWRTPKLATTESSQSFFKITDMCTEPIPELPPKTGVFLKTVVKELSNIPGCDSLLLQYFKEPDDIL